ncbi:regulator of chromosome condensation [Strigomonas culicis]|uniref:Regulator of chromosome condensation n=1 Tax=Strigomonas culicis TaxID=28005 RepID=S9UEW5_9TRYP|nr:regulator of chromosome condensation [Strigomonas culicis]|eukprot:EPY27264.1 regulator of chromosome condensation [Strigomonas culicis]
MAERVGLLYVSSDKELSANSQKLLERYINGDGVIVGWGLCRDGELGTGNRYNLVTPFMIGGHDKPIRMACSSLSSCWLGIRNVVMTMGSGMWGELAVGNPRFCPRVVANEMNMPICPGQIEVPLFTAPQNDIVIDIAGGFSYFTCISLKGSVYAWGANNYAQCHPDFLRNACCGFAQPRTIPNEVVVQVACANFAVLARTMSGAVYGWGLSVLLGDEKDIEAGLASRELQLETVQATPDRKVVPDAIELTFFKDKAISLLRAGPWHFAAVTKEGRVYTWGLGNNGRLGHGDEADQIPPTLVEALREKKVIEVACGSFHTVFVTADGEAYACGDNEGAQCGVVGEFNVLTPTLLKVCADRKVIHAGCGRHHTLLLLETGEFVAFGSGIGLGVGVGYGLRMVRCQPVMENYTSLWLSSGATHNFALTIPKATTMLVLGVPHRGVPAAVTSVGLKEGILSCGIGSGFTLMISRRGSCYAFGVGGWGQLGYETSAAKDFTPDRVPVVPHATRLAYFSRTVVTYVAAGFSFSMAIIEGERVYAWGNNSYGQCGIGVDPKKFKRIPQPREIEWLCDKEIVQVACGSYFALAMSSSGDVYSWGAIECCGIGLEPSADVLPETMLMRDVGSESQGVVLSPVKVPGLSNIIQIATGGWHALALNPIGEIYAWGVGAGGRLGLGDSDSHHTPVRIKLNAFVTRIGAGCYTSFAIDDDAKLYVWGVNDKNQLGVAGKVNTPTMVLKNVRDACVGKTFTLALTYESTFHMAGTMEFDTGACVSNGFHDVINLPERLQPINLRSENFKGVRVFAGQDHAIILLEKDTPPMELIGDVTASLRRQPEASIVSYANKS